MKYIITEDQLEKVKEKILKIPFNAFNNDWDLLQKYLERKNFPPYILLGDLDLSEIDNIKTLGSLIEVTGYLDLESRPIKSLGNLTSVGESLNLYDTPIESLGNLTSVGGGLNLEGTTIKSLGNLTSVGEGLYLHNTPIESLGNLTSVGMNLSLANTPISIKYTRQQIRDMIEVGGRIFL